MNAMKGAPAARGGQLRVLYACLFTAGVLLLTVAAGVGVSRRSPRLSGVPSAGLVNERFRPGEQPARPPARVAEGSRPG